MIEHFDADDHSDWLKTVHFTGCPIFNQLRLGECLYRVENEPSRNEPFLLILKNEIILTSWGDIFMKIHFHSFSFILIREYLHFEDCIFA